MVENISREGTEAREKVSRRGAEAQSMQDSHLISVFSAPLRVCVIVCLIAFSLSCGVHGTSEKTSRTSGKDLELLASVFIFTLADCPICNAYIPELNRIYDNFFERGVNLTIIPVDSDITLDRVMAHRAEYDIRMPFMLDPEHDWVNRAGVTTAPEAAVFSPEGELLYRGRIDNQYVALGKRRTVVTSHDLRDALEAILAGKPVPSPRTEAIGCPIPPK
jgi:hypothetical protein